MRATKTAVQVLVSFAWMLAIGWAGSACNDPSGGYPSIQVSPNLTEATCPDIPGGTLQASNGECLFNEVTSGGKALGEPCESSGECTAICCFCPPGSTKSSYATRAACIASTCADAQGACDVLACDGACDS